MRFRLNVDININTNTITKSRTFCSQLQIILDVRKIIVSRLYLIMLCLRFMHTWGRRRPFLARHLQRKQQLKRLLSGTCVLWCVWMCRGHCFWMAYYGYPKRHIVVASTIYEVSISVVNVRAVWGSECQFWIEDVCAPSAMCLLETSKAKDNLSWWFYSFCIHSTAI